MNLTWDASLHGWGATYKGILIRDHSPQAHLMKENLHDLVDLSLHYDRTRFVAV